jgi:O-Antigen ligase
LAATRTRRDSPSLPEVVVRACDWSTILLAGLLGARFLLPTETAVEGDTLWLVVLTLAYCAAQHWLRWRNGEGPRRLDRVDAAMLVLVAAHLLSSGVIVLGTGQKRAAINVAWEWLSSILLWFEFRKRFESGHGGTLIRTVLALCVVLAGYGIWQNQVWFRENAQLVTEWESLQYKETALTNTEAQRMQEIAASLGRDFQTVSGGARRMLIDRLRSSTEPVGCFALANSLAGLLVVGLWLALSSGLTLARGSFVQTWGLRLLLAGVYGLLGVCLVMTKSRTAYLGLLVAGGAYWFVGKTGPRFRTGAMATVTVGLAGIALLSVALLSGLIDSQVISEAPKSVKYRLEYWVATSGLILDHIWLGVGPGNFRPNYLHYKLPGASEEIFDPHNLLLDVWANAGVVAWAGLLALLIWGMRTGWRAVMAESEPQAVDRPLPLLRWSEGLLCSIAGPALVTVQQIAFGAGADGAMWVFLIACPFVGGWLTSLSSGVRVAAVWAAWLALSLHLFGAGGIAMPAIFQTWALLLACLVTPPSRMKWEPAETPAPSGVSPLALSASLGLALGCGVLGLVCLRTSLIPNTLCRAEISLALDTMARTGNHGQVGRQLLAAAEFDPLNPEPWMWLLQLRAKSELGVFSEEAQEAGAEAILRNPASPLTYEILGDLSARVEPSTPESQSAAIQWYREAAERYPNSARIRASLALAQLRAGHREAAAQAAEHALRLDDLNQSAGHVDKVLPPEQREILEEAVADRRPPAR